VEARCWAISTEAVLALPITIGQLLPSDPITADLDSGH
jgi:hypothetical protein